VTRERSKGGGDSTLPIRKDLSICGTMGPDGARTGKEEGGGKGITFDQRGVDLPHIGDLRSDLGGEGTAPLLSWGKGGNVAKRKGGRGAVGKDEIKKQEKVQWKLPSSKRGPLSKKSKVIVRKKRGRKKNGLIERNSGRKRMVFVTTFTESLLSFKGANCCPFPSLKEKRAAPEEKTKTSSPLPRGGLGGGVLGRTIAFGRELGGGGGGGPQKVSMLGTVKTQLRKTLNSRKKRRTLIP